jgi:hypothetical protein
MLAALHLTGRVHGGAAMTLMDRGKYDGVVHDRDSSSLSCDGHTRDLPHGPQIEERRPMDTKNIGWLQPSSLCSKQPH